MREYVPIFLHLFGERPSSMTYNEWLSCKRFADDWIAAQKEGTG